MQIELKADNREEFERLISDLQRVGSEINDVYEPEYKILATVSKTAQKRLRQEGINIGRSFDDLF